MSLTSLTFAEQLAVEFTKTTTDPGQDIREVMKHPINYLGAFNFVSVREGIPVGDCSPIWGPPHVSLDTYEVSYSIGSLRDSHHNGMPDPVRVASIVREDFNSILYNLALEAAQSTIGNGGRRTVCGRPVPSLLVKAASRSLDYPRVCDLLLSPTALAALRPELSKSCLWTTDWSTGCIGAYRGASLTRVRSSPHHQGSDFLIGEYGLFYRESPKPPTIDFLHGGETLRVRHELGVGVGNPGAICKIVFTGVR